MSPFTPAGDKARWRYLYDLLVKTDTGGTVTYETMAETLDLDPQRDRHVLQMAMRRAAKEHLEHDQRSVASVPNVGYRIVETERKLDLAKLYQGKAQRSVRQGRAHVEHADLSDVDEATRALFEAMAWKFAQQDEVIHRLDVRQKRHERQLQAAVSAQKQTEGQLADLRARLEKLEGERELTLKRYGMARSGRAWRGVAWRGPAWYGAAWLGLAPQGQAGFG